MLFPFYIDIYSICDINELNRDSYPSFLQYCESVCSVLNKKFTQNVTVFIELGTIQSFII